MLQEGEVEGDMAVTQAGGRGKVGVTEGLPQERAKGREGVSLVKRVWENLPDCEGHYSRGNNISISSEARRAPRPVHPAEALKDG